MVLSYYKKREPRNRTYDIQPSSRPCPAGRGHDPGQHHPPPDPVRPAAAGRKRVPAALQHGGHLGGGQLCVQRGLFRRGHRGAHHQYAHRLLYGPVQRRGGGHQPILRGPPARKGPGYRPHGHGADPGAVRGVHGPGPGPDPGHAGPDEHPGGGAAGIYSVSVHLFLRHHGPADL